MLRPVILSEGEIEENIDGLKRDQQFLCVLLKINRFMAHITL